MITPRVRNILDVLWKLRLLGHELYKYVVATKDVSDPAQVGNRFTFATDKANVNGLNLGNTVFALPSNVAFQAAPQVALCKHMGWWMASNSASLGVLHGLDRAAQSPPQPPLLRASPSPPAPPSPLARGPGRGASGLEFLEMNSQITNSAMVGVYVFGSLCVDPNCQCGFGAAHVMVLGTPPVGVYVKPSFYNKLGIHQPQVSIWIGVCPAKSHLDL